MALLLSSSDVLCRRIAARALANLFVCPEATAAAVGHADNAATLAASVAAELAKSSAFVDPAVLCGAAAAAARKATDSFGYCGGIAAMLAGIAWAGVAAIDTGDSESNRSSLLGLVNLAAAAGAPRDAVVGAQCVLLAVRYTASSDARARAFGGYWLANILHWRGEDDAGTSGAAEQVHCLSGVGQID